MQYILVIAPMDQVFVGPFQTEFDAKCHMREIHARYGHDCSIMNEFDMRANIAEFGEIPVQSP